MWKRAHTVAAAVTAVVLVGGGVGAGGGRATTTPSPPTRHPDAGQRQRLADARRHRPPATPDAEAQARDPLTGGKVSGNPVIAVKVENTSAARPQVGLNQADIVFVAGGRGRADPAGRGLPLPAARPGSARCAVPGTPTSELLPLFGKPGLVYSGANGRVQRKHRRRLARADLPRSPGTADGSRRTTSSSTCARIAQTERARARPSRSAGRSPASPSQGGRAGDTADLQGGQRHLRASATPRAATPSPGAVQRYVDGDNDAVDPGRQRGDHAGAQRPGRQPRRARAQRRCCPRRSAGAR